MSTSTAIIVTVAVLAAVLEADLGRRRKVGWFRVLRPILMVGAIVPLFLTALPTGSHDLLLQAAGAAVGLVLGIAASALMPVSFDPQRQRPVSRAGVGYVALWVAVSGGRLAFIWGTHHGLAVPLGQWMVSNQISSAAIGNAFLFLSLVMALSRSVILGSRALNVRRIEGAAPAAASRRLEGVRS